MRGLELPMYVPIQRARNPLNTPHRRHLEISNHKGWLKLSNNEFDKSLPPMKQSLKSTYASSAPHIPREIDIRLNRGMGERALLDE